MRLDRRAFQDGRESRVLPLEVDVELSLLVAWAQIGRRTRGRTGRMSLDLLRWSMSALINDEKKGSVWCRDVPPVSTPPPVFFNLGMPPANSPPSCGAAAMPAAGASGLLWSLFARARFPGTGGASADGAFAMPGIGGAPATGAGPPPPDALLTMGADRSFVTAFLRGLPLVISVRSAPFVGG